MDQAEKLRIIASKKREGRKVEGPRLIAVSSGKGGVGKTYLAVNLSLLLLKKGFRVGLLDADLGMANVDVVLGINPSYNLSHLLFHDLTLNDIVTKGPLGLQFIAGASGSIELASLTQERIFSFLEEWKRFTYTLDFLIVDTSPGISRAVTSFVQSCDESIIICTPDPLSITDAYSMVKVISNHLSRLHLVINRSTDHRESHKISQRIISTANKYLDLEINMLGIIPEDPKVLKALNRQRPLLLEYPTSRSITALKNICQGLVKEENGMEIEGTGFVYRLLGLFRQ